jgi:hypothetical protein
MVQPISPSPEINTAASPENVSMGRVQPYVGAWGKQWDVVMCLVPIAFLVVVTVVKPLRLKTSVSLPLSAAILYIIRLAYFGLDPNFTNATVIYGLLDTLTPLSIITGAICLFEAMEETEVSYSTGSMHSVANHSFVTQCIRCPLLGPLVFYTFYTRLLYAKY